jgi:hypothetical protein
MEMRCAELDTKLERRADRLVYEAGRDENRAG